MNWNHVWELFKINLLYANPQAVTNLQKRQEKKKKANFSIVNAMLRQQLLILIIFTVVYSYLFVGVDYKANPGVLTLDRKSTRLNSSHSRASRMPSSA